MGYATKKWLYQLGSAFIGSAATGGAGILASKVAENHIDWPVVLTVAGVAGLGHVFMYLQQFPLPEWDGIDRRGSLVAAAPEAIPTAQVAKSESAPVTG